MCTDLCIHERKTMSLSYMTHGDNNIVDNDNDNLVERSRVEVNANIASIWAD